MPDTAAIAPRRIGVLPAVALVLGALAGCAQFGLPAVPPSLRPSEVRVPVAADGTPVAQVYVVYRPHTVLGFGHTGVIVAVPPGAPERDPQAPFERYDQYASAELAYGDDLAAGTTYPLEGSSARVPSVLGLTRESVRRFRADSVPALLGPDDWLVPLPGLAPGPVRAAALARFRTADGLDLPTARRYSWLTNNCHHFVRAVLRQGGEIPERYFPKHFVQAALERLPPDVGRPAEPAR